MNKRNIWNYEQNKPTLVVDDIIRALQHYNDNGCDSEEWEDRLYQILLSRGVFKWLAVRRDLIKLKDKWKTKVRLLQHKKTDYEKGYLKALEECRAEVRALCHSERWRAPDNDRRAQRWLNRLN